MKKQSGFTLIELIIAVAILGILASVAVPNFGSLLKNSQLKSTYNSFVGTIATARAEAVKRRTPIIICPSANRTSCLTGDNPDWSEGYIAYADANGNLAPDSGEVLTHEAIPNGVTVHSPAFKQNITIASRGRLSSEGTVVFCKGDDAKTARALNLWITGLGRLATDDKDDDGIVEGPDGEPVTCS